MGSPLYFRLMTTVPTARVGPGTMRSDVRVVGWWVAMGAGTGGLLGFVVGGLGGRLLMLFLRIQSPGASGLISDDGFEIGRITLDSLNLAVVATVLGAVFGASYVALRRGLPPFTRVAAATLVGATVGGTAFLNPEGIDLLVLQPLWVAVSGFIALPAICAGITATLVERWSQREPWSITLRQALVFTPALLAAPAVPLLALGAAGGIVVCHIGQPRVLAAAARLIVTGAVGALILVQLVALIREVDRIL